MQSKTRKRKVGDKNGGSFVVNVAVVVVVALGFCENGQQAVAACLCHSQKHDFKVANDDDDDVNNVDQREKWKISVRTNR